MELWSAENWDQLMENWLAFHLRLQIDSNLEFFELTELSSSVGSSEGYNYGKLDDSLHDVPLVWEYGTEMGSSYGTADGLELVIYEGTYLGSPVGSSEGYNCGKLDGSLDRVSLGWEDGTTMGSSDRAADGIELGIYEGTEMGSSVPTRVSKIVVKIFGFSYISDITVYVYV